MTLSDPLLKELKGHIITLFSGTSGQFGGQSDRSFGDDDEAVFLLCHCLESIFLKGLVRYDGFTPWKADCFQWFYQVVRKYQKVIPLVFKSSFEDVLNDKKTKSHIGKTRLLIRTCLKRKCLHVPLELHVNNRDYDDDRLRVNHKPNNSIMGHEILSEIFLSLLFQLSNVDFNLDLSNSSFLDESWQLPELVKVEMVPCSALGVTLGFPLGFPVIVNIIENSAAGELSDQVAVGDILDEINGTCLRNLYGSKIESLFKKVRAEPFRITVIKGHDPKTSQVYLPVIKLYRILGLKPSDSRTHFDEDPIPATSTQPHAHGQISEKQKLSQHQGNVKAQPDLLGGLDEIDDLGHSDSPDFWNCHYAITKPEFQKSTNYIEKDEEPKHGQKRKQSCSALLGDAQHVEEVESPTGGENQIPISKFYGEDGDHFMV